MRRFLLVVIALGLAGCGSDRLDAAFGGLWTGPVTLTMGSFTSTETVQITIMLPTETTLTISPVCPGNAGSITASGSGNSASWSGSQVCPAFAIGSCASVTVTLTSGTGSLSSDGRTLSAQASGTASGCATSTSFSWSFSGVK